MKKHKTPMRICISCRNRYEQKNMLRIVINKENQISIDLKGKKQGRGAYICKNISCVMDAKKTKALSKAFKTAMNESIYDEIRKLFENERKC